MPGVEGALLLANSAEANATGGVSALGIGWDHISTPTPPMALLLLLKVPWDLTNHPMKLEVNLVDEDGQAPLVGQDHAGNPAPFQLGNEFEVGRPPGARHGSSTPVNQVINLGPGIPLPPKRYEWKLEVEGKQIASASFTVIEAGPQMIPS